MDRLDELAMPFAEHLSIDFVSAEQDRVVAQMVVTRELCTGRKILHGGAVMALADTAGAAGTILNLPECAWTATIESKTNFLGPVPLGATVTVEATPIHIGRRTMVWQSRLTTDQGKLVAIVTQTQMVLEQR